MRELVSARTPWGKILGYSRAVRVGRAIFVSGTAASDEDGRVVGVGDAYAQTAFAIRKIEAALSEFGASLSDVARTRIFTSDMKRWREIARAHSESFGEVMPASTLVQVSGFIDPEMLVELEAEAVQE